MNKIKEFLRSNKRALISYRFKRKFEVDKRNIIGNKVLPKQGPLVSIVMTVYNREMYIRDAIDSIINQSYKDIELIIINDGSTDKSEDIIMQYKDPRIKYFYKTNSGQLDTFKFAYKKATGEYVTRLDSDDVMDKDMVALCMSEITNNEDIDFVYYNLFNMDSNSKFLGTNNLKTYNTGNDVLKDIFNNFYSVIPDVAFWRRDYLVNIERFYIEGNVPFYINDIKQINYKHIPLPLYFYRLHDSNYASNLNNLKFVLSGIIKTIEFVIDKYEPEDYLEDEKCNDPYLFIAKRYYDEALKYREGIFSGYVFNKSDKVYEMFLEKASYWIEKANNSEGKKLLIEKIKTYNE